MCLHSVNYVFTQLCFCFEDISFDEFLFCENGMIANVWY